MGRNHIHIAPGRPGASGVLSGEYSPRPLNNSSKISNSEWSRLQLLSGMRTNSAVLIHIDVVKAMGAGIKFYRSANNVILTPGNEEGFLLKEYFSGVERRDGQLVDDSWRTI
jgi:2'-phosphotransferase